MKDRERMRKPCEYICVYICIYFICMYTYVCIGIYSCWGRSRMENPSHARPRRSAACTQCALAYGIQTPIFFFSFSPLLSTHSPVAHNPFFSYLYLPTLSYCNLHILMNMNPYLDWTLGDMRKRERELVKYGTNTFTYRYMNLTKMSW